MIPAFTVFKNMLQSEGEAAADPGTGVMIQEQATESDSASAIAAQMNKTLDSIYSQVPEYKSAAEAEADNLNDVDLEIYRQYSTAGEDVIGQEINLNNLEKALEESLALFPEPTGNVTFEDSKEGTDAFLRRMIPIAKQVGKEIGLDWKMIIGQTALETGWGTSVKGNSFFGVKAHGADKTIDFQTTEEENGEKVSMTDSFRAYDTPEDSARDYGRFLQDNPRYSEYLAAETLEEAAAALQASGYATDSEYGDKVLTTARGRTLRTFLEENPEYS